MKKPPLAAWRLIRQRRRKRRLRSYQRRFTHQVRHSPTLIAGASQTAEPLAGLRPHHVDVGRAHRIETTRPPNWGSMLTGVLETAVYHDSG